MFKTIFPRTKFADETVFRKQLKHLESEFIEVAKAFNNDEPPERVAAELCDLIQSAESGLNILHEKHGMDVAAIQRQVVEKNRVRGHYPNCNACQIKECGYENCFFKLICGDMRYPGCRGCTNDCGLRKETTHE